MDLDRFLSEQNLARFRRLLDRELDAAQRRQILELLGAEQARMRQDLRLPRLPYEHAAGR